MHTKSVQFPKVKQFSQSYQINSGPKRSIQLDQSAPGSEWGWKDIMDGTFRP